MASGRMGVRCNLAVMLVVMLAAAGVLQECEALLEASLKVRNHHVEPVKIFTAVGQLVVEVEAGASATLVVPWVERITVELKDGRKAQVPCIVPGPGRRRLSQSATVAPLNAELDIDGNRVRVNQSGIVNRGAVNILDIPFV